MPIGSRLESPHITMALVCAIATRLYKDVSNYWRGQELTAETSTESCGVQERTRDLIMEFVCIFAREAPRTVLAFDLMQS